jgi:asparagine synthase (glutamine-hydrolysing)
MCGFVGFLRFRQSNFEADAAVQSMLSTIQHRGPDSQGFWKNETQDVVLGHCRLAIIDLSETGHQPMHSASKRYTVSFNGEIYNFRELRLELAKLGHSFKGTSDTEVLLASIEQWGIAQSVQKFNGMFAFALWDSTTRKIYLARDRFGEKPLYYAWIGYNFVFGSELRTIRSFPEFKAEISVPSLDEFFRYSYISAPSTIYDGVMKLPPGSFAVIDSHGPVGNISIQSYWDPYKNSLSNEMHPFSGNDQEAALKLDAILREAVGMRMISDVPLGAFLSGGIDSSLVVSIMQSISSQRIKTFSIGFEEKAFDEAPFAKAIAKHLGTDHTELYLSSLDAIPYVLKMGQFFDEPFADSSQIPTLLVSKLASSSVKVALTGDGGDELFGGYNRYIWGERIKNSLGPIPRNLRLLVSKLLMSVGSKRFEPFLKWVSRFISDFPRQSEVSARLQQLAGFVTFRNPNELYNSFLASSSASGIIRDTSSFPRRSFDDGALAAILDQRTFAEYMMLMDTTSYLPNDILVKTDRSTMSFGLESRVPFLDTRLFDFAWCLPLNFKIRNGQSKWILKQVLHRHLPKNLVDRPKMGFTVPIGAWLRGPLKEWASDLLSAERLERQGLLNAGRVQTILWEHQKEKRSWDKVLWSILMFQSWLDESLHSTEPRQAQSTVTHKITSLVLSRGTL